MSHLTSEQRYTIRISAKAEIAIVIKKTSPF
jgi:hypothetical protein